jgi:hypothetical protein
VQKPPGRAFWRPPRPFFYFDHGWESIFVI